MEYVPEPTTTVIVFTSRKEGMTLKEFHDYYEDKHVPLIQKLLMKGELAPLSYTRHYVDREAANGPDGKAASFPFGGQEDWDYDCISRVVFRDVQHRDALFEAFGANRAAIAEDETRFLDSSKLRIVYITESPANVLKS